MSRTSGSARLTGRSSRTAVGLLGKRAEGGADYEGSARGQDAYTAPNLDEGHVWPTGVGKQRHDHVFDDRGLTAMRAASLDCRAPGEGAPIRMRGHTSCRRRMVEARFSAPRVIRGRSEVPARSERYSAVHVACPGRTTVSPSGSRVSGCSSSTRATLRRRFHHHIVIPPALGWGADTRVVSAAERPCPVDRSWSRDYAARERVSVSTVLQRKVSDGQLSDLGPTLREARERAGLSLSGMARRTGYSRSYLGNVETGVRQPTPSVIRAYERALGEDVYRRSVLVGMASAVVGAAVPDVAVDVMRDIAAERSRLLSTVQTSHEIDKVIGSLVAKDLPSVGSLLKWMRNGSAVLRVNAAGILAKTGAPAMDNDVVQALRADGESRDLYLTAVVSRVLSVPWDYAGHLAVSGQPLSDAAQIESFATEVRNPYDSGARWCSVLMLARTHSEDPSLVRTALTGALKQETSRENLRALGCALAGVDLLTA